MKQTSIRHGNNRQAAIQMAVFLAVLAMAFPALAGYTGPGNRIETVTTWSRQDCFYRATITGSAGSCSLHIYNPPGSCPAASGTGGFFNNASTACGGSWPGTCGTDVSCNISLLSSAAGGCSSGQPGCTASTSTITHPPATVGGSTACALPGDNGWCRGGASLSLSASEPWASYVITGIESDAAGMLCSGPSCAWASPEGDIALLFWALSSRGDTSAQASVTMKLDGTPPTVSLPVPTPDGLNGWHISSVTVTAAASDGLSGVASVSINGGGNSFTAASDGTYDLTAVAYDLAGNNATVSATFQIDATPPTLDVAVPAPDGSGGWFLHPPSLTASAGDGLSGLAGIQYSLDGGGVTGGDAVTVNTDGAHSVLFQAADQAGNTASQTNTVKLDATPPTLSLSAPTLPSSGWYNSPVDVSADASDAASGVASAGISSDGGVSWAPSDVLDDGIHNLNLRASDVAGNTATASAVVRVDSIPPVIDTAILGDEGHNGWYTSPVTLLVDASDGLSGMAGAEYRIDGGAWQSGTTVNLAVNGSHTVDLRATDLAGNTAGETHAIMLDTSLPQLSLDAAGSFHPSRETLAIGYSVTAGVSGLSEWALVVDGDLVLAVGDGPDSGTLDWDGGRLDVGDHLLTLYAADEAGSDVAISQPIQLLASSNPGPAADQEDGSALDAFPIPIPSSLIEQKPAPTDESSPDGQPALNAATFIDNPPAEEAPALAADESASETSLPTSAFPDILWGAAAVATLAATSVYTLGKKDGEDQAAPLAGSQTIDVIDDEPTDDVPPTPPAEGGPNWVYVQSPYIDYVERVNNDIWLPVTKYTKKVETIPGHIKDTFVTTIEYQFKSEVVQEVYSVVREVVQKVITFVKRVRTWLENSWLGKLVKKVESWLEPVTAWVKKKIIEPVTKWVQKNWMVPVAVTKNVQVWVPPETTTTYEPVREHPKWTAEEVAYRSIAVDCKDLPHWVAIRFFEKLDPHTPQSVQLALFNRFRDGLAINPQSNAGYEYQEALDVFFNGTSDGKPTNAPSLINGYGGGKWPDTYPGWPAQCLNLNNMFGRGYPTHHRALCGELSVMAALGLDIQAGLESFNGLQGISVPLLDEKGDQVMTDAGVPEYTFGSGADILKREVTAATGNNLVAFLKANHVNNCTWGSNYMEPTAMATKIRNGEHLIALVNLDGIDGKLKSTDSSANDIPHWVTILGVLPTADGSQVLRVYNPLRNSEELYSWSTFEAAWAKTAGNDVHHGLITAGG